MQITLSNPKIRFDNCPYNLLPNSMITRLPNSPIPLMLDKQLQAQGPMMLNFLPNIIEIIQTSSATNFYLIIFGKTNVHSKREESQTKKIKKLFENIGVRISHKVRKVEIDFAAQKSE